MQGRFQGVPACKVTETVGDVNYYTEEKGEPTSIADVEVQVYQGARSQNADRVRFQRLPVTSITYSSVVFTSLQQACTLTAAWLRVPGPAVYQEHSHIGPLIASTYMWDNYSHGTYEASIDEQGFFLRFPVRAPRDLEATSPKYGMYDWGPESTEPQGYSKNIVGIQGPWYVSCFSSPAIFLGFPILGSHSLSIQVPP